MTDLDNGKVIGKSEQSERQSGWIRRNGRGSEKGMGSLTVKKATCIPLDYNPNGIQVVIYFAHGSSWQ